MSKVIGLPSSVTSFFGESGLLGKKDSSIEPGAASQPQTIEPAKIPPAEDTRLRRIIRSGFTDMLRGRNSKSSDDISSSQ